MKRARASLEAVAVAARAVEAEEWLGWSESLAGALVLGDGSIPAEMAGSSIEVFPILTFAKVTFKRSLER